jgi:hypothetical protein
MIRREDVSGLLPGSTPTPEERRAFVARGGQIYDSGKGA